MATTTLVSKGNDLGQNSSSSGAGGGGVQRTEASTTLLPAAAGRHNKKRALELRQLREDDDEEDDGYWDELEATFVAGVDGAYTNFEMPKRINLGYDVGEASARIRTLHAEDERDVALRHRHRIMVADMIRDMYAKAKAKAIAMAKAAAAAPPT